MPRFIILEHTGAPDDPVGRHYDLLLEDGPACRTWRLDGLPEPDGPPIAAVALPPHRLDWLDHREGAVSGGRGFARRIAAGGYEPRSPTFPETDPPPAVDVMLHGDRIGGRLVMQDHGTRWLARLEAAAGADRRGMPSAP